MSHVIQIPLRWLNCPAHVVGQFVSSHFGVITIVERTMPGAANLQGGGAASSSSSDHEEIIDVVSHAVAHDSRSRNSSNSSSRGSGLRGASTSEDDDGHDDDGQDDDDAEEEEEDVYEQEHHSYRRGRHTVPMHSPGEELADIDLLDDDDQHLRTSNMPRLPRLRNRIFFQSDEGVSVVTGTGGAGPGGRMGRRVLFRRRKRQEGDVFWTAIFVSNVLSLAVLSCLVVYLTQTDFFASHQNELFGTTVDNRFTVVSQQDSRAKIYLKSGTFVLFLICSTCVSFLS